MAETKTPEAAQRSPSHELHRLLARQLRKFVRLMPLVLSEDDPGPVHDLRVASRRLQQIVATAFPKPRSAEARAAVATIARARHVVRRWRDCDVLIQMLRLKIRRLRAADERHAWELIADAAARSRERVIRKARRKLANRRFSSLAQELKKLTGGSASDASDGGHPPSDEARGALAALIQTAHVRWEAARTEARDTTDSAHTHALRIATKRIRYRIELADELGVAQTKPVLGWLKELQTRLGELQDRANLAGIVAKTLADSELLMREPAAASILLRRMAAARAADGAAVARALELAASESAQLASWVTDYCAPADHEQSAEPDETTAQPRQSEN